MPITIAYQSSGVSGAVIGTNPYSLSATATSTSAAVASTGVYQVLVDFSNIVTSDAYELSCWEKVHANAAQLQLSSWVYKYPVGGVQMLPALTLSEGWDFRLTRIGNATSTSIGIPYSVRKIS